MAERFARGGRLLAVAADAVARSDARHVAVEFVHPVIVGKRALPALALCPEGGDPVTQLALVAEPDDIVLVFGDLAGAERVGHERGCLTLARLGPGDPDPFVAQEIAETLYHILWELVHVFLDHRGLLSGRSARATHDTGASSFLYPFLGEQETDLDAVLGDVRESVALKSAEILELRERTVRESRATLAAAAAGLRERLDGGGRAFTLGNGGSATDAMDAAADLREPPFGWPARPALDLTEDTGILTAVANDVGAESMFARQVIAHGRPADALLAFTTSGGSSNVIAALAEARRRELLTVAWVGYDGGRIAGEGLADHVIVSPSEHIPRIQEAQATAWHVLRGLLERVGT